MACITPASYDAFWTAVNAAFFVKFPERASLIAEGLLLAEDAEAQPPTEQTKKLIGQLVEKRKKVHIFAEYSVARPLNSFHKVHKELVS